MPNALNGIQEKLKRANENILNLETEITAFLQEGPHPVIPNNEPGAIQESLEWHASREIPDRFAILSGEIIHHLRSCLDNIAWQLSSSEKRLRDPKGIEFPVYISKPTDKKELCRYERKVEGISARGREIIESLQPYHRDPKFMLTGPRSHPLWIIHEMDTLDKHRELVITTATFSVSGLTWMEHTWLTLYRQGVFSEVDIAGLGRAFNPNSKVATQIAFREFGGRKVQPVIPSLQKLTRSAQEVLLIIADGCF